MRLRTRPVLAATAASAVLVLGAVGCGSGVQEAGVEEAEPASTTGTTDTTQRVPSSLGSVPPDSAGLCDVLARIAAADRASTQASQGVTEWAELQPLIVENARTTVGLYDEALALAPEEVFEDLLLVRDVTDEAGDAAQASATAEEFQAAGQDLDDFGDAQAAVEDLNAFTQRTCGFTLADN